MIKPGMVRFVLATLVVLFHITKLVFLGPLAVFCFFILSGYWVSLMYENKYSKKSNPIMIFYVSRLSRLLPLFYLISIFTFFFISVFTPELLNPYESFSLKGFFFWFSNIFLFGYNQLLFRPLGPAWSLDIELQFYILLPFLFFLMKSKFSRVLSLLISLLVSLVFLIFYPNLFLSNTIFKYLVYFLIGVAIFKSKIEFTKKTEILFNFLFLLFLVMHYSVPHLFALVREGNSNYNEFFNLSMSFLLIPFLSNSVLRKSNPTDMLL
jgi:peptidoglycan/LPS O-acetylase OafA/YrhL